MATLDSHAPFVLDTHELGRRPGTSLRVRRMLPAPAGLVVGLAAVRSDVELDVALQLEAVMEGVFVSLRTIVPVQAECARCLDPIEIELDVEAQELYVYPSQNPDPDALVMDGDLLDLEPVLRDAIGLALPATIVCREDCPGLCPECGARLADAPDHSHGPAVDPRWAALRGLAADPDAPTTHETPEEH